jgi:MFS superfamily sulfate permease-like transporter
MGQINFKIDDLENFKVIRFKGNLNYINCTEFEMKLLEVLKYDVSITIIHLDEKGFIDVDGIETLQKLFKNNINMFLVNT